MLKRLILNDLRASKLSSLVIFFFIFTASLLSSLVALSATRLFTSIDELMANAEAPHFIQMHQGDMDKKKIDAFATDHGDVRDYQILPFINMDNDQIAVNGNPLLNNSQDNGFSSQSKDFDYLLDLNNKIAQPQPGQVYVPLSYYSSGEIKKGDVIHVAGLDLEVMGPIRDVQMNSPLSSSKRFLVNPKDLEIIKDHGKIEYLIEFRLSSTDALSSFGGDYAEANLYANGPTITYPLIRLVNGLTEGIMLAVIALIAFFTLFISFLCIRFSLLAKLEEESKEIAVLKGLGIPLARIKGIYLAKYLFISFIASLFGFIAALFTSPLLLKNIRLYLGSAGKNGISILIASCVSFLLFFIVMAFTHHILRRFKKISPRDALFERDNRSASKLPSLSLLHPIFRTSTGYLAYIQWLHHIRLFISLSAILIIASFMVILPTGIANTIGSRDFVRYMGIGDADYILTSSSEIRADVLEEIKRTLATNGDLSYDVITYKAYDIDMEDGNTARILMGHGDHESFPLHYSDGRAPRENDEIAISYLIAKELHKSVGDTIAIDRGDKKLSLKIVGIYSDITNGGMTGIAKNGESPIQGLRTSIWIGNARGDDGRQLIRQIQEDHPELRILGIDDFRYQVLGSTIDKLNLAKMISYAVGVFLVLLITILFTKLMVIKDRPVTSILKAMGFSNGEIAKKYYLSVGISALGSMVIGILLNKVFGNRLASLFMENLGIGRFEFLGGSVAADVGLLVIAISLVLLATSISLREIPDTKVADYIKE